MKLLKNQKGYSIAGVLILISLLVLGGYFYYQKQKQDSSKVIYIKTEDETKLIPPPPITNTDKIDTSNWKTREVKGPHWFYGRGEGTWSYKYPNDWVIEEGHNGHPNHATLYGPDKDSCIKFTFTGMGPITMDQMLQSELRDLGSSASTPHTVLESSTISIDNRPGRIEKINLNGEEFYAAVGDMGNCEKPGTVYVFLTTCSLKELSVLNGILESIVTK